LRSQHPILASMSLIGNAGVLDQITQWPDICSRRPGVI
jgi:hypothetical protein